MFALFPDIKPYKQHRLEVEPPHTLYVEECGEAKGVPVLFVHGGPGAGCESRNRCFFDPGKYRIILFDQRGAGRSEPHAELDNNHTAALIEDMEVIRQHLGIDKWVLFGGSWGSTLSLVYAETYPERVAGLILRGIFLGRRKDLNWFYQDGASRIFPDHWQDFIRPIPPSQRGNYIEAYNRLFTDENEIARMAAAKSWALWEARCATLRPNRAVIEHFSEPRNALALARIEAHYFVNNVFLEEDQVLKNAENLQGIPGIIVHGRYDVVCPVENAYELQASWPEAELHLVRDAGHASSESGITDALIRATQDMARLLDSKHPTD